ncbi:Translocon at the outer membrane of chloroplasts 64 [Morus notabilis]|uniref:Translocon at the outer membrane of chloroplasts 64 n=1 Tax=Morus notabilis TaxID=981085 RepID=W9RZR3_9ROSA|nr:Translocon at the outer membrane of chloroplasts 64 [Morus notabilis]
MGKNTLYGINVEEEFIWNLALEVGSWLMKYLGLPLGGNPLSREYWNPVVEKWLERSKMRRFLWDGVEDGRVDNLVAWKTLSRPKEEGGLAIGNLLKKNQALLGKWLWRHEFRHNHEEWINMVKPVLDPVISSALHETLDIEDEEIESCKSIRNEIRSALNSLLKDDGILVIPTIADPPPKVGGKEIQSEEFQNRAFALLSIASMSGCCQVTVPLGSDDNCPVSVSLIARHGADRFLLDALHSLYTTLREQTDVAKSKVSKNIVSREQSAEIAKEKGNQAYKEKQWHRAISYYTEAIKLCGDNATYYSNRAAAYLEVGSFLQAEADCTKAINLDKKSIKSYLRRGTAREMLGYYKEAIEDFKYALVLEPTNKRAALSAEKLRKLFQ